MSLSQDDYEDLDNPLRKRRESIYLNPVFDGSDEISATIPLLGNANDEEDEQSPYEEVAANVSNKDDPTMLCLTTRSICIGLLLTCVVAFTYQFFAYRTSPIDLNIGIVILVAYMLGKVVYKLTPKKLFGKEFDSGPFTVKELALVTIMATAGSYTTYAIESITIQRLYYNYYLTHFNAIIYIILMHLLAFSIAGVLNRYLVWPAPMIWPKTLMSCCLIRTLDAEDETAKIPSKWKMKRSTFFWLMVAGQFAYFWLPGYIFPLLSFFSFICMIAPNNILLSQITGANGLGIGALEFDWNALVAYLDSPILVPFWAHLNVFAGFAIVIWGIVPLVYYFNVWDSKLMPIISNNVFDDTGNYFNTSMILDSDLHFNETAYQIYGGVRMAAGYAIPLSCTFATVSALIIDAILYHGKTIAQEFKSSISDKKNDIHTKLMSRYPQVPDMWYYALLVFTAVLGVVYCTLSGIMPGYIFLFSVLLDFLLLLPMGIITAMTNMMMSTSALSDVMSCVIVPGNPIGYLGFRIYTYSCQFQTICFLTNFKIAHYMKIPPRVTFFSLLLCPILNSVISYITGLYLLDNIPYICTPYNAEWRCLNAQNSYSLSVIWGVIGASRLFGPGSDYTPLLYAFLLGAVAPVITWSLWKLFPNQKWLAFINFPIIFQAVNFIPPAPAASFVTWFLVGFIFNFVLYRYAHQWWEKYAYIVSAGMSCGVVICGIVIFFTLENNDIKFPTWWGMGGPSGDGCPLDGANFTGYIPTYIEL